MPRKLTPYQKLVKKKAKEGLSGAALFRAAAAAHHGKTRVEPMTAHKDKRYRAHHMLEHMQPGYVRVSHNY